MNNHLNQLHKKGNTWGLRKGQLKGLVRKCNAYGNSSLNDFYLPLPKPNVTSLKDLLIPIKKVLSLVERDYYASILNIGLAVRLGENLMHETFHMMSKLMYTLG